MGKKTSESAIPDHGCVVILTETSGRSYGLIQPFAPASKSEMRHIAAALRGEVTDPWQKA